MVIVATPRYLARQIRGTDGKGGAGEKMKILERKIRLKKRDQAVDDFLMFSVKIRKAKAKLFP